MEFSLETAGLATAIGLGVITLTLIYLWATVVRVEAIAWWAAAFAALSVDYSMILLQPLEEFGLLIPVWEAAHATFLCCVVIGVLRFLGRPVPFALLAVAWAVIEGWGIYASLNHPSFVVQTLPATIIASGLTGWSALLLLRQRPEYGEPGYRLAGWAFAVWAFNRANFPLLAFMPWFAPIGYVIAEASALAMGIGLLVAVLERLRRQALASEDEARNSRNQVMEVMEASPVGTVLADPSTQEILFANRTFKKLVAHWEPPARLDEVLHIDRGPSWRYMANLVLPNGSARVSGDDELVTHELWAWDPAGNALCLLNVVRPIHWGGLWRVQNTLVDITRLKEVEKALAEARDEAEAASRSKTRFLAAASHDLRQPLQALMMFIDAFEIETMDAQNRQVKERIEVSLEALKKLLDTLLDISRLDAGLILADMQPVELGPLFERLAGEFTPQAEQKNLAVGFVPTKRAILADPVLFETLVRNLLTNAIRYTDEGRILLGCKMAKGKIGVGVWDTGRGIGAEDLEKIFEDFHQVGNQARDRRQGLGLGLSIVKRMTHLMGMSVVVRSVPGKGSAFILQGDETETSKIRIKPEDVVRTEKAKTGASIVLIEDEVDILDALTWKLQKMGHNVSAFKDFPVFTEEEGKEAPIPDLIIADYRLAEGRTGIQAIDVVRKHFAEHIPAMLITGDTAAEHLAEIRASGFPFLHKPVAIGELKEMLDGMLDEGESVVPITG